MKKIVTLLTLLVGTLSHASSPEPAVAAAVEVSPDGVIQLDLKADPVEAYRVSVRQLVASSLPDVVEAVPVADLGLGAGERRLVAPPRVPSATLEPAGSVIRVRYEIETLGLQSGRTFLQIVDCALAASAGGELRRLSFDEELKLAPPAITLTGEPVPAAVLEAMAQGGGR